MKKQKTLRALLATVLLVVMLVINVPVFAATPTGSITLTKMESGATITVYKIADFNVDADGQPTYPTYRWVAGVDSWMQTKYPTYANTDAEGARGFENATDKTEVYGAITAAIRTADSGLSLSALTDVSIADGGEKEKVISGLSIGTYLVVIEGADRVYQPIVRNVGLKEGTSGWEIDTENLNVDVEAKSTPVSITKTASGDHDVNTTEEVTYTITADVPKYPDGAISHKFVISDKLPSSMSLKEGSIVVTKIAQDNTRTPMTEGTGYSPVADADKGDRTFALDFTYSAIEGAKSVEVVYIASLNPDASTTIYGSNLNEAFLDYSNDPYVASSSKTVELTEKPDVKTYGFNIQKKDGSDNNLPGAEFKVYDSNAADATALKFRAVAGQTGVYYYDPAGTVEVLQGNTDGKIEVRGLASGTYYVEETKAPDGDYNKLPGKTTVVVGTDAVKTQTIVNKKGFQLPITGGMGTVLFTVAGIAFIVVGAAIVISKKRSSKN